jgi:hypothetical protein
MFGVKASIIKFVSPDNFVGTILVNDVNWCDPQLYLGKPPHCEINPNRFNLYLWHLIKIGGKESDIKNSH